MIQLALANWSDLFQPRRSRSLDSRVNPKGNTAAPQRAQNAPPLLSQSPASPPSTFSQPIQHDVVADDDDSYLLPWGDKPVPIDTGKVLRVIYQNVAHGMSTSGSDPALLSLIENLVTAQGGRKHDPTADKGNEHPKTNRGKEDDNKKGPTRRKQALCPHCKAFGYHKPENCLELEANKDKRRPGWKSTKATTA